MNIRPFFATVIASLVAHQSATADAAPAYLTKGNKKDTAFIVGSSGGTISYKSNEVSTRNRRIKESDLDGIYFIEPKSFREGRKALAEGKLKEARDKFKSCRETYAGVAKMKGNYSTLATLEELRCARLMGDLKAYTELLSKVDKDALLSEADQLELELGQLWDALGKKDWDRLERLLNNFKERDDLSLGQRAQISFLKGEHAREQGDTPAALIAYAGATTADFGNSKELLAQAITTALEMLDDDKMAQKALKDQAKEGQGAELIAEAKAMTKLWEATFSTSKPLPAKFKKYAK